MKATVLIADDDAPFLASIVRTLKRGGYDTIAVNDGCEVPKLLERTHIDLLVLDLQMPGMNGWEVLRRLRGRAANTQPKQPVRIPKVLVVSGRSEDETVAFVRRLGADAYLTKPVSSAQLLSTVRRILGE